MDPQTKQTQDRPSPPLNTALLRGWRRRCPNCGHGPLLRGYLRVRDDCAVCGQPLHPQGVERPTYLTVAIVALIAVPCLLGVQTAWHPDPLVLATVITVGAAALGLYLLPRLTGILVAFRWAKRMHGF